MIVNWFLRGILAGIRTERLPRDSVSIALSEGLPARTQFPSDSRAATIAALCPTGALVQQGSNVEVITGRCVACMRCRYREEPAQAWRADVRWSHRPEFGARGTFNRCFHHSIHARVIDAGDCGSCLNEIAQLNGPSYNLHRFGIFITPTPRQADVLLVVGPVTRQMREPLKRAYEAMPTPKRVVALGACAASGGIFGPSVMTAGGVGDVIPVDLIVPGCPPPPLAIIEALRSICGQGNES